MSSSSIQAAEMPSACPHPSSQASILNGKPEDVRVDLPHVGAPNSGGTLIRRAVSDSHALSKALLDDSIPGFPADLDEDNYVGLTGLESTLIYGPNSPRSKGSGISDYALVSALSESVSPNYQQSVGEPATASTLKRNPWQHSRDRKVQYIAELKRTINTLQTLNKALEVRAVSQKQQCVALSMENNNLMQRLATLEGEYQLLKEENERLKLSFSSAIPEATRSLFTW
ncbi:hypothetical protein REPUB_Repub13aG0142800 [Reevesia pubescens]